MKRPQSLSLIILITVIVSVTLWRIKIPQKRNVFFESTHIPYEAVERFHLKETIGGNLQWELSAKKGIINGESVRLYSPHLDFFSTRGSSTITLISTEGLLNTRTKRISLPNKVVVTTDDGVTFVTSDLRWDSLKKILTTNKKISIKKGNFCIEGYGLNLSPDDGVVTIHRNVKIILNPGS